ncbi:MAG: KamA family radical SAM protein [Chlamydiia bacterium]|nr:KamA family radical SAM protein [Chlamydiia bacterium]
MESLAAPLWRTVQRENFTRITPLVEFLELSAPLATKLLSTPRFPLNLPRRLALKIAKNTLDDPILRQFVPLEKEALFTEGFSEEPLQDQAFRKTKKILKKYHGRALLVTTGACAMNCRFCFRQNFPYETEQQGFEEEIAYLSSDTSISEVILSGGDPLSLSDRVLATLFSALDLLPHIRRIRFHTRFPVGVPERIDNPFLMLLASSKKQIFFTIHCNHPIELDEDVLGALKQVQRLGIPVLNQSVLLKGVNDTPATLLALSERLIDAGIIPYYLHEHDRVQHTGHFALPASHGKELIAHLQKHLSGFGVPRLVREEPGQLSKTFISTSDRQS